MVTCATKSVALVGLPLLCPIGQTLAITSLPDFSFHRQYNSHVRLPADFNGAGIRTRRLPSFQRTLYKHHRICSSQLTTSSLDHNSRRNSDANPGRYVKDRNPKWTSHQTHLGVGRIRQRRRGSASFNDTRELSSSIRYERCYTHIASECRLQYKQTPRKTKQKNY